MSGKIIKEIFIIVLLFIVVMFTIGILLYEFIPGDEEEVFSIENEATEKVLATLSEIQSKTGVDNSIIDDATGTLLKSYSITKDDLSDYKTKNYYESGKKDPFAEYSETVDEEVVSTTKIDTENENKTTNTIVNMTVTNTVPTTNTVSTTNTVTVSNTTATNTVTNTVKDDNTNNTTTQKNQNTTTGTYFEKENSK